MGAPTSDTFTSSVDSTVCDFALEYQGLQRDAEGNVSVRTVPYGTYVVVQRGGGGPKTWQTKLYVPDTTNLNNLEHCRGHVGTLVCFLGTFTVVLQKTTTAEWYPATAEWGTTATWIQNTE